jgi:hypothetical protein
MDFDAGLEVLDRVANSMSLDPNWLILGDREVTWWGHELRQRIWAESPVESHGMKVSRVQAESDALVDVDDDDLMYAMLDNLNGFSSLFSWVYVPEKRSLKARSAAYVHEETVPMGGVVFGASVALMAADATGKGAELADEFGGKIDRSAHPQSGPRHDTDEMLGVIPTMFAPMGSGPSPAARIDFGPIADTLPSVLATGGRGRLTAEYAFSGTGSVVDRVLERGGGRARTALCRVLGDSSHPQLGSGCLILLLLPAEAGGSRSRARLANDMNLAEFKAFTGFWQVGAWCTDPNTGGLAHATFVPAVLCQPIILGNLVAYEAGRVEWARAYLDGKQFDIST